MSGYFALAPRPIEPEDFAGAQQLLATRLGITPYVDRAVEVLAIAKRGGDAEHRAFVVARDGTVAGLALFGSVAGTLAAFRLHLLLVQSSDADVAERLLDAVTAAVAEDGGAFIIAEMAEEPALLSTIGALLQYGFAEVGRVPDYFRDGVPLVLLRRDLR